MAIQKVNAPKPTLGALIVCSISLLLTACASSGGNWEKYEVPGKAQDILARQSHLGKPTIDLSEVTIVRLDADGKRYDVSSLTPLVLTKQAFGWGYAKSQISLDEQRKNMILFTYDVKREKAYQTQIPLAELQPGKAFTFPVLGEQGVAEDKTFTVNRVIVQ